MYQLRWRIPNGTELLTDEDKSSARGRLGGTGMARFDILLGMDRSEMLKSARPLIKDQRYVVLLRKSGPRWLRVMEWKDGIERRFDGGKL